MKKTSSRSEIKSIRDKRWLLLKRYEKLSKEDEDDLMKLLVYYPEIQETYLAKENFLSIYDALYKSTS